MINSMVKQADGWHCRITAGGRSFCFWFAGGSRGEITRQLKAEIAKIERRA